MRAIEWYNNHVRFIDQTRLPAEEKYIEADDYSVIIEALRTLKIRGAPAIGIAAAYGVALSAYKFTDNNLNSFGSFIKHVIDEFASTRPTAINLFWALRRMQNALNGAVSVEMAKSKLILEAITIHKEDEHMCELISELGSELIPFKAVVLTHCNTGTLATGGVGTALGIIIKAHSRGKFVKVVVGETRPLFQGARLTSWELKKSGIDVTLITDSTAAVLMSRKKIDLVIVGADRIANNGDVANKIGTYNIAVNAKYHNIPFFVAAPFSSIDISVKSGSEIPIEERDRNEITEIFGHSIAPADVNVYSPAFDITPFSLVTSIITDRGIYKPPFNFSLLI